MRYVTFCKASSEEGQGSRLDPGLHTVDFSLRLSSLQIGLENGSLPQFPSVCNGGKASSALVGAGRVCSWMSIGEL